MHNADRAFEFLRENPRPSKPRACGVTEIRGPYYPPMGRHDLQDILETMGAYAHALKFAGGSFSLMPRKALRELLDLCHAHQVPKPLMNTKPKTTLLRRIAKPPSRWMCA